MLKAIEVAKVLSNDPDKNHLQLLKDVDLFSVFQGIYKLNTTQKEANLICAFLIYAYDPDSQRLNFRKDRYENKQEIMKSLELTYESELLQSIVYNECDPFTNCFTLYLEKLTDWRWPTIYSLLDYHSSALMFANKKTESEKQVEKTEKDGTKKTITKDIDMKSIGDVNMQKSDLLKRGIDAREQADRLLEAIRKDFMPTDTATSQDYGFAFTETAKKKVDIYSWREFITQQKDKGIKIH